MKKLFIVIISGLILSGGCVSSDSSSDSEEELRTTCTTTDIGSGTSDVSTYANRKQAYIRETVNSSCSNTWTEVIRLSQGIQPDESEIQQDLDQFNARQDTADFKLPSVLRLLYQYSDSDLLSGTIRSNAKSAILGFKYWPDELNDESDDTDTDNMCSWSENHFILFSSGAYLAGQLYPNETFKASGETGTQKMATFRPRIMRWLELRYKSGFSEWLSNVYYNEDIPALIALIDLCEDEEITGLATMVLDLILADMALNHFEGTFGSTHGRTYKSKMSGIGESTAAVYKLLFNLNDFSVGNMSASSLTLSENYQLPRVLYDMAVDSNRTEFENKQRMGIRLEEASSWGLSTSVLEDGMTFLTLEAYTHPLVIDLFKNMLDSYKWWENSFFSMFKTYRSIIEDPSLLGYSSLADLATAFEKDITRNMRPEVNIYTYRKPDYMLSTAQDWRKGYGGDQQSIWQATLGAEAVAFTTHPATETDGGDSPNYWVGYGTMPRAIQVKNVVISLYDIDTSDGLYVSDQPLYTHAYLPKGKFDEAVKESGWFFARKDDGYLALWTSDSTAVWVTNDNAEEADKGDYEIIASGEKTIWICELGSSSEYADFDSFKSAIAGASLTTDISSGMQVTYESPSQGTLVMNWDDDLTQDGSAVNISDYKRYENPYSSADFPGSEITFELNGESLTLNFSSSSRTVSSYLQ